MASPPRGAPPVRPPPPAPRARPPPRRRARPARLSAAPPSPGRGGAARWEGKRVYGEGDVAQRQGLTPAHEPLRAEAGAQATDRLIQGVAGLLLGLFRPQQAQQMIARTGPFGREGEVDEQSQMLAPQHVGGRRLPAELHRGRAEANQRKGGGGREGGGGRMGRPARTRGAAGSRSLPECSRSGQAARRARRRSARSPPAATARRSASCRFSPCRRRPSSGLAPARFLSRAGGGS